MKVLEVLRNRRQFVAVQTRGKRFRGRHIVLLALAQDCGRAGYGLTVSRKVGGAVVRNRVRRRLREIIRRRAEALCSGFDYVIIAAPSVAAIDYAALERDAETLFGAARRWVQQGVS